MPQNDSAAGRPFPVGDDSVPVPPELGRWNELIDALADALNRDQEHRLSSPAAIGEERPGRVWSGCLANASARMSPRLAYGRHRGPASKGARRAAVVILIYPDRRHGIPCLTLTRRPQTLSHHGGQVCLPGGRIESGETAEVAARREYHEELGIEVKFERVLGRLAPMYVFASDNLVETLVATASRPKADWNPDPVEVDQVIEMPLAALLSLGQMELEGSTEILKVKSTTETASMSASGIRLVRREKSRMLKAAAGTEAGRVSFRYPSIEFLGVDGQTWEVWGATALLLDQFSARLAEAAALLRE